MSYEILKSQVVYRGKIFDIVQKKIKLPNGREGDFDVINHNDSVAILPVDQEKKVWLVRQYRYPIAKLLLEIPAGVMEDGEEPIECAQRELREEIGMGAEKMEPIGKFYLAGGFSTEYMHVFLASGLFKSYAKPDEDEFIRIEKYPISEVLQMAKNDELEDAKTLAAFYLAYSRLKQFLEN
jgi:ADP-ribose pyrophosphatase